MARAELGIKRQCGECSAKFYDLGKDPIVCPKCGAVFALEPAPAPAPKRAEPAPKKPAAEEPAAEQESEDTGDVEVVSLEDAEPASNDNDDDDDIPEIEDEVVDLEDDDSADDDTFLEEDDEDGDDVSGLIGGVSGDKEEN